MLDRVVHWLLQGLLLNPILLKRSAWKVRLNDWIPAMMKWCFGAPCSNWNLADVCIIYTRRSGIILIQGHHKSSLKLPWGSLVCCKLALLFVIIPGWYFSPSRPQWFTFPGRFGKAFNVLDWLIVAFPFFLGYWLAIFDFLGDGTRLVVAERGLTFYIIRLDMRPLRFDISNLYRIILITHLDTRMGFHHCHLDIAVSRYTCHRLVYIHFPMHIEIRDQDSGNLKNITIVYCVE